MWRGTVEPLYKGTGKLPCGGDNILMGPPSWEAVSPSNIYISKDFFLSLSFQKDEYKTQSKSTSTLDLYNCTGGTI